MRRFSELPTGATFEKAKPQIAGAKLVKVSDSRYAFLGDSGRPCLRTTFRADANMPVIDG